jgi:hypothetical protein
MPIAELLPEIPLAPAELPHPSGSIDEELDQLLAADPASRAMCPMTTFSPEGPGCCF